MFLTICIPTYNRAYVIERAINSVIDQSDADWELLIIDDGSNDNTREVVYKYLRNDKIRYYYKENGGKHSALNIGLERAEGDYFLILDSDDYLDLDCVKEMKHILLSNYRNSICGVIGKCINVTTGEVIGEKFKENDTISYVDIHFRNKKNFGDCCECINSSILKKYRWPEIPETKFVPESYVLDKIGVNYRLICSNKVFKFFEYLDDGITKNALEYQKKNNVGFLINYVDKLDNIFIQTKVPIFKKISIWALYWRAVSWDIQNSGPRVKRVGVLGKIVKFLAPTINKVRGQL